MSFLSDTELKSLLTSGTPPIKDMVLGGDLDAVDSPVQACSVDLTVGEIFLPSVGDADDARSIKRTFRHVLPVGASVRIETREKFDLPNDLGAFLLAPARITRRGIVISDVGHVDPGFEGPVRLTLINMGRSDYVLAAGNSIITVLLFRLTAPATKGLADRAGRQPYEGSIQDIQHLASDFLNFETRVKTLARKQAEESLGNSGWKYAVWQVIFPILLGFGSAIATFLFAFDKRVAILEAQTESQQKTLDVERRLGKIETTLAEFKKEEATNADGVRGAVRSTDKGPVAMPAIDSKNEVSPRVQSDEEDGPSHVRAGK